MPRRYASLGLVKEYEKSFAAHEQRRILEWLAVTYSHSVTALFSYFHSKVATYPVHCFRSDFKATPVKSFVFFPFSYIYYVALYVARDDEHGFGVPSYCKPLALTYGIELRPLVSTYNTAVRIELVTCFLYVLFPRAVVFGFKFNPRVIYGSGYFFKFLIGKV